MGTFMAMNPKESSATGPIFSRHFSGIKMLALLLPFCFYCYPCALNPHHPRRNAYPLHPCPFSILFSLQVFSNTSSLLYISRYILMVTLFLFLIHGSLVHAPGPTFVPLYTAPATFGPPTVHLHDALSKFVSRRRRGRLDGESFKSR